MNTEKPKIPAKAAKTLRAVYDACLGVASEFDAFDGFYEGGADQLLADFASALKALGVKTLGPDEGRAAAEARVWDAVNVAKFALAAGASTFRTTRARTTAKAGRRGSSPRRLRPTERPSLSARSRSRTGPAGPASG